jgi:hypothetical protein
MAGLNIDQILRDLEREKTAEQTFLDSLQDTDTTEPVAVEPVEPVVAVEPETVEPESVSVEPVEPVVKTAEAVVSTENVEDGEAEKLAELQKEAAEYDERGRVMARAFINELEKYAAAELENSVDAAVQAEQSVVEEDVEKLAEDRTWIISSLYNQFIQN